jgi:zinc protease
MRLREADGLSYGVWGGLWPGDQDPAGQVMAGAIIAPQNVARGQTAMLEEIRRAVDAGITPAELEVARKGWIEQQDNLFADDAALAGILAHDRERERDFGWYARQRAALAKVSADDVNRAFKTYLQPAKLLFIVAGDKAKASPGKDPNAPGGPLP